MMWNENRKCKVCGYPVTYWVIDSTDSYDQGSAQFVYVQLKGPNKGLPETGDWCPKCHEKLTLKTTEVVDA
jgi:hypothetical protein